MANKLFISAFVAMDIATRLSYGDGNLTSGSEKMKATGINAFIGHFIMGGFLLIFMFPYYPTERKTSLSMYLIDWIPMLFNYVQKIMNKSDALTAEEAEETEAAFQAEAEAEMEGEMSQDSGDDQI